MFFICITFSILLCDCWHFTMFILFISNVSFTNFKNLELNGHFSKYWISKFWFFIERIVRRWIKVSTFCDWFETKTVVVWPWNLIAYFLTESWCHFGSISLWITFHILKWHLSLCRGSSGRHSNVFITIHSITLNWKQ